MASGDPERLECTPAKQEESLPERVLVLGDGTRAFLAVVRSLGRMGLEVHAAQSDLSCPALRSRYVAATQNLPKYRSCPQRWEEALRDLVAAQDYRLVIPVNDASLLMLHHHAEALGSQRLALPNADALKIFTNKGFARTVAQSVGVPICRGRALAPEDDPSSLIREFGLPLALKPASPYVLGDAAAKREVRIIHDKAALERELSAGAMKDCVIEAFFAGQGVGVSIVARRGEIMQAYQHRRLRESSEAGMSTSRISEAVDDILLASVKSLARALQLHGVAMFEFRHNNQSGEYVLLEVNLRFWGSLPLALAAGADFPAMLYDLLVKGEVQPAQGYQAGVRRTDMTGDYYRLALKADESTSAKDRLKVAASVACSAIRVLFRRDYDSWAADDEGPFLAERRALLQNLGGAIARRIAGLPLDEAPSPGLVSKGF